MIHLVRKKGDITLMLVGHSGNSTPLNVELSDTVMSLKVLIRKTISGITSLSSQKLTFESLELTDESTALSDYGIRENSTVVLSMPQKIHIRTPDNDILSIKVHLNESVDVLKEKISQKLSVPCDHQRLFYNGQLLEGEAALTKYGIREKTLVFLSIVCVGGLFDASLNSGSKVAHWPEQGVKIAVPNIEAGEATSLKLCACKPESISFTLPDNMELVSSVYEVSSTEILKSSTKISVFHSFPLATESACHMTFVCSSRVPQWKEDLSPSYTFRAAPGGAFEAGTQTGVLDLKELNCFLAIAKCDAGPSSRSLWGHLAPGQGEGGEETPTLSSRPKLHQLQALTTPAGRRVKVKDEVAHEWQEVAVALHFDGGEIEAIRQSTYNQSSDACRVLFSQWLQGGHRKPVSWETLAQALTDAGFIYLAQLLRDTLRH